MVNPNLELLPHSSMIAGARFVKKVNLKENNRIANADVPDHLATNGLGELCTFLQSHPLQGALFNTVSDLYPRMLNEWWYTCTSNVSGTVLTGTYNTGHNTILITEEILRYALGLPREDQVDYRFQSILSKQEARNQAFPLVGQDTITGTIKYGMFKGKWQFLFSVVVRCLGGKSGSQDQMNEFETTLFHSLVTGRRIDYAHAYFQEILSYVNASPRMFNVPFTRILSLCFSKILGKQDYANLSEIFYQCPVPKVSDKIFHNLLRHTNEVGLTPTMLVWIAHPYVAPAESESDLSDLELGEDYDDDGANSEDSEDHIANLLKIVEEEVHSDSELMPLIQLRQKGTLSKTLGKSEAVLAQTIQPTFTSNPLTLSEVFVTSETTPVGPSGLLDDQINPTEKIALMDTLIHEVDGYVPPSSASEHYFSTPLESELNVSEMTNPSQLQYSSLESHITAAVLSHTVCIEEEIPLLDPTTLDVDTPFTLSFSKDPIFTSSVLVHTSKPITSSQSKHSQVANVILPKQSVIQTSSSVSKDRVQFHPVCCEGTTSLPFIVSSDRVQFQPVRCEGTTTLPSTVTSEISALRVENPKDELQRVKDLVSTLAANVEAEFQTLKDDVKEGEKSLRDVMLVGTQTDMDVDVENADAGVIMVDASTQTVNYVLIDKSEGANVEGELVLRGSLVDLFDIRMEIKKEVVFYVNFAHQLGYITQEEYQDFCVSNTVKLNKKSFRRRLISWLFNKSHSSHKDSWYKGGS